MSWLHESGNTRKSIHHKQLQSAEYQRVMTYNSDPWLKGGLKSAVKQQSCYLHHKRRCSFNLFSFVLQVRILIIMKKQPTDANVLRVLCLPT